jgi:hypothetical protein
MQNSRISLEIVRERWSQSELLARAVCSSSQLTNSVRERLLVANAAVEAAPSFAPSHRASMTSHASPRSSHAVASLLALVLGVAAPAGAHAEGERRHRLEVGSSAGFVVHDCACDGYNYFEGHEGFAARVGYRFRAARWLDVGIAPTYRVHSRAQTLTVPLLFSPGWSFGGENRGWLTLGGGLFRSAGDLSGASSSASGDFHQAGGFAQIGGGGALQVAPDWSVFLELAALAGAGTIHATGPYPGGYFEGQRGTWFGASLDLGVRWAL